MPNQHVASRLKGIQTVLRGVHESSSTLSSATKGSERAAFVDDFLSRVLPPIYRFGSGDATDSAGRRTGQLDVVVEYPFMPSLPTVGSGETRLYLAESVAAVVEVKSNASSQWSEALATATALSPLQRRFGAMMVMGTGPSRRIPLFVAGYEGWKKPETVQAKLDEGPVDGILVLDPGIFVSSTAYGGMIETGELALWGLICCLHQAASSLQAASTRPIDYVL